MSLLRKLAEVEIRHDYFTNGRCTVLKAVPSRESARAMGAGGIPWRMIAHPHAAGQGGRQWEAAPSISAPFFFDEGTVVQKIPPCWKFRRNRPKAMPTACFEAMKVCARRVTPCAFPRAALVGNTSRARLGYRTFPTKMKQYLPATISTLSRRTSVSHPSPFRSGRHL